MKVTTIDMSKVDKSNPFKDAVWKEATIKEKTKFYKALSKVRDITNF